MPVDHLRQFFIRYSISPARVLAAVSGGGDSTALLLALCELRKEGFEIVAAHVNHHLRGAESDGDEQFIRELCARNGVGLHVADGTLAADAVAARGVEAAAREIRIARLQAIRADEGAAFIATAHHRDDQAETVLMRLMNGGGPAALRGIRAVRDDGIIRPLLDVTRAELDAFLRERGVTPRRDSSNADPRFLRNRVRAMLGDCSADVREELVGIAADAARQWPYLERAIDAAERDSIETRDRETRFRRWPEDVWLRQAILHRQILRLDPQARDVSESDLERLARNVEQTTRVSVTRDLELIRRDGVLTLRRRPHATAVFEVMVEAGGSAVLPHLEATISVLRIATSDASPVSASRASQQFCLPRGAEPRFTVRNRREGDRFQPLGMRNEKKLKRFLIDRKVPAETRDHLPLLVWNGAIVWIAGIEVSERFKITAADDQCDRYEVKLDGPQHVER